MRKPSHATVVAYLALFVALGGTAAAATGGNFVLGRANSESTGASLSTSSGSPLALNAPSGHAPLAVNQRVQVNNLNAQYVGGRSAAQLGIRSMFSFRASHVYPIVTGSAWRFVSDAPLVNFTDRKTTALVTGTLVYWWNNAQDGAGSYLGVCYETGGHTLTSAASLLVEYLASTVPATVTAVVTNLTGKYYVGLCAHGETPSVTHGDTRGTVLVSETP